MAVLIQHAPGTFSWPELATTDQDGAKKYYGALFGWTSKDFPMGPDAGVYTILQKNGKDACALFTLSPEQRQMGIPPNWGAYVTVVNADAAAEKAKQLGGTILLEPFDVMGTLGRMAVIQDPTGAVFSVWQAKDHIGANVLDEPGSLTWTELMTPDAAKSKAFYTALIGWTTSDMPMPQGTYTLFKRADGTSAAGMMPISPEMGNVPPHWLSYFQVEDVAATAASATQLGGAVMVPPTPVPNVGQFAILKDPQGAVFAILQPST